MGVPLFAAACERQKAAESEKRFDGKLRLPPGQTLAETQSETDPSKTESPSPSTENVAPRKPEPKSPEHYDARHKDRQRLPPDQYELRALRDMGGSQPLDTSRKAFRLKVHGEVSKPLDLGFLELAALPNVIQTCDVHCVTKWSMFDTVWRGVRIRELAERAGVSDKARHVIFEAAHGYTANIPLEEAMKDNVLVAWEFSGAALAPNHGAPVRSLVPDLYFWKSAKWLTGVKFVVRDEPGYWERGIYHNHGDPWKEERFNERG